MNRYFEQVIDSLNHEDRAALRMIGEEPDSAWLCHQSVLWSLMRKSLINVIHGRVEVTDRGHRVIDHLDYLARKM